MKKKKRKCDSCEHKEVKWHNEPCFDCKNNPSRYINTEPIDRYEKRE